MKILLISSCRLFPVVYSNLICYLFKSHRNCVGELMDLTRRFCGKQLIELDNIVFQFTFFPLLFLVQVKLTIEALTWNCSSLGVLFLKTYRGLTIMVCGKATGHYSFLFFEMHYFVRIIVSYLFMDAFHEAGWPFKSRSSYKLVNLKMHLGHGLTWRKLFQSTVTLW